MYLRAPRAVRHSQRRTCQEVGVDHLRSCGWRYSSGARNWLDYWKSARWQAPRSSMIGGPWFSVSKLAVNEFSAKFALTRRSRRHRSRFSGWRMALRMASNVCASVSPFFSPLPSRPPCPRSTGATAYPALFPLIGPTFVAQPLFHVANACANIGTVFWYKDTVDFSMTLR
jgi:hypothetical protein